VCARRNSPFPSTVARNWTARKRKSSGRNKPDGNVSGNAAAEERARITEIRDLLIGLFLERTEAIENGDNRRVRTLQSEIDDLLREKDEIEKWAVVGSA
jgi:hypothetical protein